MNNPAGIAAPPAETLAGKEPFEELAATVADFWAFAMSDLRTNNARGYLAEYFVARALGLSEVRPVEWNRTTYSSTSASE